MSTKAKILIVDDEPDLVEITAFRLQEEGFETLQAKNSQQALEIVKNEHVQVVLTDIRMPGIGGIQLLDKIKSLNPVKPRVFVVTGSVNIDLEEIFDIGAEGIFAKPIDFDQLIEAIKKAASPSTPEGELRQWTRFPGELNIELKHGQYVQTLIMNTTNIGRGGVFVRFHGGEKIEIGDSLEFVLNFKDGNIQRQVGGHAKVIWKRGQDLKDLPAGIGLKFENFTSGERQRFLWYLNGLKIRSVIPRK